MILINSMYIKPVFFIIFYLFLSSSEAKLRHPDRKMNFKTIIPYLYLFRHRNVSPSQI